MTLQLICLSGLQECGNNEKHAIFWSALGSSPRGVCLHCALNPSGFAASQSLSSLCTKPGLSCLCLSPWKNSVFLVAHPVWGEKGSGRFLVSGKPDGCPSSKLWVLCTTRRTQNSAESWQGRAGFNFWPLNQLGNTKAPWESKPALRHPLTHGDVSLISTLVLIAPQVALGEQRVEHKKSLYYCHFAFIYPSSFHI